MAHNKNVEERLEAIQELLMSGFRGGKASSSSTKGRDREAFIRHFFGEMLPALHRLGSGDITDSNGARSGQVDLVIEYPFLPSFPTIGTERLYLAEGVAAVFEIKSDLKKEWPEVRATAERVKKLFRVVEKMHFGSVPEKIPVFAVGYTGWKTLETVQHRIKDGFVDGILVIDRGFFASAPINLPRVEANETYSIPYASGPWSLWGLLCCLHQVIHGLQDDAADFSKYHDPEKMKFLTRLERSDQAFRHQAHIVAKEWFAKNQPLDNPPQPPTEG
jgi:hypothetical protein